MKKSKIKIDIKRVIKLALVGISVLIVATIIFTIKFQNQYVESKFLKEMASIPEAKGKIRNTFEGGATVNITIPNKGSITVMYGISGIEGIWHIGKYNTAFMCQDNKGYSIVYPLELSKNNNRFKKWFPFQINNLKDLVTNYDNIIYILNSFPELPNSNYTIKAKANDGSSFDCYLTAVK